MQQMPNSRAQGNQLESLAADFLVQQGCKIIQRNFSCKLGEIDIIAKDKNVLCFVEVRYRKRASHGGAIASVDKKKQHKIIRTADFYLQINKLTHKVACRFDVLAIQNNFNAASSQWIKQAFDASTN